MIALDQHPLTLEACAILSDVKQRIFVKHCGCKNGREQLQLSTVENPKLCDSSLAVFFGDHEMDMVERFARRWVNEGMTGGAKVAVSWSK